MRNFRIVKNIIFNTFIERENLKFLGATKYDGKKTIRK